MSGSSGCGMRGVASRGVVDGSEMSAEVGCAARGWAATVGGRSVGAGWGGGRWGLALGFWRVAAIWLLAVGSGVEGALGSPSTRPSSRSTRRTFPSATASLCARRSSAVLFISRFTSME
jgi:hypothetical protein